MAGADRSAVRVIHALAALVLAFAFVAGPVGAHADEADDGEAVELEVSKEAYWTNPAVEAFPDILFAEFPPGVVCLVFPELCGEDAGQFTDPVDEARGEALDEGGEHQGPAQPVDPRTYPVGRAGGEPRYGSAFTFELPPTPEGQEIARFELVLDEGQPTYSLNSPAFRQAVLAGLVGVQEEDPVPAAEQLAKIIEENDEHPFVDDEIIEIEACPAIEGFEAEENQHWDDLPEADCILGATGLRSEEGVWTFDLTWAAQAWESGDLSNEGVVLLPVAAPNLAWGDADTSDHAQISLFGAESDDPPRAVIEYQEQMDDTAFDLGDADAGPSVQDSGGFAADSGTQSSNGGEVFGRSSNSSPDVATADEPVETAPAPEIAQDDDSQVQAIRAVRGDASTPASAWLGMLLGAAALFGLARMLEAAPAGATERGGAMTRLIESRSGSPGANDPTGGSTQA